MDSEDRARGRRLLLVCVEKVSISVYLRTRGPNFLSYIYIPKTLSFSEPARVSENYFTVASARGGLRNERTYIYIHA